MEWLLLAYRMPREPSTPRITVWRKLARLGVAKLGDGLVALPADARSQERLEWIADEVTDAAGEATLWKGRLTSAAAERVLVRRMAAVVGAEYSADHCGRGGPSARPGEEADGGQAAAGTAADLPA